MYFLQFDNFTLGDIWKTSVTSMALFLHFLQLFSSIITELKQQNCVMENQILKAISYTKNVSKKSPTAEIFLNHISKTSASNIDLSIKEFIAENKINYNFEIIEESKNGDLIQSIDEGHTLVNDELNETLDWSPTAHQLVSEKQLGILIIATTAILKTKNNKCGPKKVFKPVKDSVETGLTKENVSECLGQSISNKSLKHN